MRILPMIEAKSGPIEEYALDSPYSRFTEALRGEGGANSLAGGGGNDRLEGGAGARLWDTRVVSLPSASGAPSRWKWAAVSASLSLVTAE